MHFFVRILTFVMFAFAAMPALHAQDKPVTVFAAASLKTALDEVIAGFGTDKVTASYAASSALAKQIESGAPADLFISADLAWMDYLKDKNLVKPESVVQLLGNELVLVAPVDVMLALDVVKGFDLDAALNGGKLAMADVSAVPAGKYGKESLQALGAWDAVSAQVVQSENVRAALKLVALKEAVLGIVYASDAVAEPQVKVVGTLPADSHKPIVYPMALTTTAVPGAPAFATYLQSAEALAIFKKNGFQILTP
jgi:molybdate transport system substrate-binding protein